jgi:hypothetical protein
MPLPPLCLQRLACDHTRPSGRLCAAGFFFRGSREAGARVLGSLPAGHYRYDALRHSSLRHLRLARRHWSQLGPNSRHFAGPAFLLFRSAPELSYVITQAVFCIPGFVKASLHQCLDPSPARLGVRLRRSTHPTPVRFLMRQTGHVGEARRDRTGDLLITKNIRRLQPLP